MGASAVFSSLVTIRCRGEEHIPVGAITLPPSVTTIPRSVSRKDERGRVVSSCPFTKIWLQDNIRKPLAGRIVHHPDQIHTTTNWKTEVTSMSAPPTTNTVDSFRTSASVAVRSQRPMVKKVMAETNTTVEVATSVIRKKADCKMMFWPEITDSPSSIPVADAVRGTDDISNKN